jgi:hypothetical protein
LNLLDKSTFWVFISGSDENQYVQDILFGTLCLVKKRDVSTDSIAVFIDKSNESSFIDTSEFPDGITISSTCEMPTILKSKKMDKIVVVVTGHGNERGIQAYLPDKNPYEIRPNEFIELIQEIEGLKYGLIILCQCYAGTFNFLDVTTHHTNSQLPEISIIGATDLQVSISAEFMIKKDLPIKSNARYFECEPKWIANFFLVFFMYYIAFPENADGDELTTILNIYKLAGAQTNKILIKAKQGLLLYFLSPIRQSLLHDEERLSTDNPINQDITTDAEKDYLEKSALLLSSQNPWISNVDLARRLTV